MNGADTSVILVPSTLVVLVATVIALTLYWSLSQHLTWASRVRRVLEREGFTARHMERRWLTRGPFPDMWPPGAKYHKEWLIRVLADDRDHQPHAGWLRWHSRLPWEKEDRWAVRWDETPDSTSSTDGRTPGISSALFFTFILVASAVTIVAILSTGAVPRFRIA